MIPRNLKSTGVFLLMVSLIVSSCAAVRPRKVSERGSVRTIQDGPVAGFTTKQELTSVTDVVWKLEVRGEPPVERSRNSGLKVVALYEVLDRQGNRANVQVTLEKVEILRAGKFVQAPFVQFGPPNPLLLSVDFEKGAVDFSSLELAFDEWVKGLQESAVWDVMGGSFDVKAYVSQLENLLASPITEFAGKTMKLGEEDVVSKQFVLPFLGPAVSVEPVMVEHRSSLRGVMDIGGREIAMIEGGQFSDELSVGKDVLASRLELFGRIPPEYFESRGELAGKFRARVDSGTGWTVETTRKIRSVIIVNFEDGSLREDISGKKSVYEL